MKVLVAAEDTACIKEIICIQGTDTSIKDGIQPISVKNVCEDTPGNKIEQMALFDAPNGSFLAVARKAGSLQIYKTSDYSLVHQWTDLKTKPDDAFVSLKYVHNVLALCSANGILRLLYLKDVEILQDKLETLEMETHTLKSPISVFEPHPTQPGVYAYGGKENDVQVIQISKGSVVQHFKGKNVKNDRLDLRVPVWITGIMFIDVGATSETPEVKAEDADETPVFWKFVTATHYGQVRIYDTRKSRRPVVNNKTPLETILHAEAGDQKGYVATCFAAPHFEADTNSISRYIICADNKNTCAAIDYTTGRLVHKYKGPTGSVSALQAVFPSVVRKRKSRVPEVEYYKPLLATGSLDRYLRVYDFEKSTDMVAKVYVGTKINCVVVADACLNEEEAVKQEEKLQQRLKEEEDGKNIWDELEEAKPRKRIREQLLKKRKVKQNSGE